MAAAEEANEDAATGDELGNLDLAYFTEVSLLFYWSSHCKPSIPPSILQTVAKPKLRNTTRGMLFSRGRGHRRTVSRRV